jgi:hypothetical protein
LSYSKFLTRAAFNIYVQVLAIFASTEVVWPESVQMLFRLASLFNFSINLTPPECAFSVTYRTKWLVMEFFPTVSERNKKKLEKS